MFVSFRLSYRSPALFISIIAVSVLLLVLLSTLFSKQSKADSVIQVTETTFQPEPAENIPVLVSGIVRPASHATIYAESAGRITSLPAVLGTSVSSGDILSVQNNPVAAAQLARIRAEAALQTEEFVTRDINSQARITTASEQLSTAESLARLRTQSIDTMTINQQKELALALDSATISLVRILDYINTNRSLFLLQDLTRYEQAVAKLYEAKPRHFSGGILTGETFSSEQLAARVRALQTDANNAAELDTVTAFLAAEFANIITLLTTAEPNIYQPDLSRVSEEIITSYQTVLAEALASQQQLEQARVALQNTVLTADEAITELDGNVAVTRVDRDLAEAQVAVLKNIETALQDSLRATIAVAETEVAQGTIRSPFSGVVVEQLIEVGEYAQPGTPLLRLEGSGSLELEVTVPVFNTQELAPGVPFAVNGDVIGYVDRLAPHGVGGSKKVVISLIDTNLPTGSSLAGSLLVPNSSAKRVLLPRAFLHTSRESVYVITTDGDRVPARIERDYGASVLITTHDAITTELTTRR